MSKDCLKQIALKAVEAVRPGALMRDCVKYSQRTQTIFVKDISFELKKTSGCHVVGFGKAVLGMASELYNIVGPGVISSGKTNLRSIPIVNIE